VVAWVTTKRGDTQILHLPHRAAACTTSTAARGGFAARVQRPARRSRG
jgi:hypothetical protein